MNDESQVTPLTRAEALLLDSFVEGLKTDDFGRFHFTCDFLEGATQAAKAKVRLDRIGSSSPLTPHP